MHTAFPQSLGSVTCVNTNLHVSRTVQFHKTRKSFQELSFYSLRQSPNLLTTAKSRPSIVAHSVPPHLPRFSPGYASLCDLTKLKPLSLPHPSQSCTPSVRYHVHLPISSQLSLKYVRLIASWLRMSVK